MKLILALVIALAAAGAENAPLKVVLKERARIGGDWFALADVAEVSGGIAGRAAEIGNLRLGHTPLAGNEREMTAVQIEKRLRELGVTEEVEFAPAPSAVVVTAAVRPLPGSELVLIARAHLESVLSYPGARVEIEDPTTPRTLTIPDEEPEIRAEVTSRRMLGLVPVAVEVFSRGKKEARVILSFRVRVIAPVPVAARALEPGEVISAADLEERERELSMLPESVMVRKEELIGLKASRPIPAGGFIRKDTVERPELLKKGSQVMLVARVGTVEVRTSAQAKDGGAAGEMVSVENTASKKTVKGRTTVIETGARSRISPW